MQVAEIEKPIILKKTFCSMDNPLIFLVLIPYTVFGWISVSHLPTVALYWTLGTSCLILLIFTFYKEYLILKKEGVSLIKGRKEINFISWDDLKQIEVGFAGSLIQNHYIRFVNKDRTNDDIVLGRYLDKLHRISTVKKIKTHINLSENTVSLQKKYYLVSTICFWLILILLILWNILEFKLEHVHVSTISIDKTVITLMCVFLFSIFGLIYLFYNNKLLLHAFLSAVTGLLFVGMFSTNFVSSAFKIYNENVVLHTIEEETSITAKLLYNNNQRLRQDWQNLNKQKPMRFIIENWKGINTSLVTEKIYEIPVYEGKFNYLVITKEQFERAKAIK